MFKYLGEKISTTEAHPIATKATTKARNVENTRHSYFHQLMSKTKHTGKKTGRVRQENT